MIELVKKIAESVFYVLQYDFTLGDVTFSAWDIFMTFLVCQLVGYAIYAFISGITKDDE